MSSSGTDVTVPSEKDAFTTEDHNSSSSRNWIDPLSGLLDLDEKQQENGGAIKDYPPPSSSSSSNPASSVVNDAAVASSVRKSTYSGTAAPSSVRSAGSSIQAAPSSAASMVPPILSTASTPSLPSFIRDQMNYLTSEYTSSVPEVPVSDSSYRPDAREIKEEGTSAQALGSVHVVAKFTETDSTNIENGVFPPPPSVEDDVNDVTPVSPTAVPVSDFSAPITVQQENSLDSAPPAASNETPNVVSPVSSEEDDELSKILKHVEVLPGERLIMHLSDVYDVGTGDDDGIINLSPAEMQRTHANLIGVTNSSVPHNLDESTPQWSAAMTFYRLILYTFPKYNSSVDPYFEAVKDQASVDQSWTERLECKATNPKPYVLQIPLACLDKIERVESRHNRKNMGQSSLSIVLYSKDHRPVIRFNTASLADSIRAHEALSTYAFPGRRNLGYLFAFESKRGEVVKNREVYVESRRYKWYSAYKEFERQGCLKPKLLSGQADENNIPSPWVMTAANMNYKMCGSYPAQLVVPRGASENNGKSGAKLLIGTAAFRSEARFPVLTWGSAVHAGSIWRSSQPKVGIQTNRSAADEAYMQLIANAAYNFNVKHGGNPLITPVVSSNFKLDNESQYRYKILDLRPKSSAVANRTQGYGYETPTGYPQCDLKFCNIGNIHAVTSAFEKICHLCVKGRSDTNTLFRWAGAVEDTKWLQFSRLILKAAHECACEVNFKRIPVLVHCSHGWDRTSQVCALAQIFLDPHYRTMAGFAHLIEKDFLSFGHPFHLRTAHGESREMMNNTASSQTSPIFVQYLDCVWQLVQQYPDYFEFKENFLVEIADHIYSCRFGTFLCDTERDRVRANLHDKTYSIWDFLMSEKSRFENSTFKKTSQKLIPPLSSLLQRVRLWEDYFILDRRSA